MQPVRRKRGRKRQPELGVAHAIQNFPVMDYLKHHYSDGSINSTGQYHAVCVRCKRRKFYFDPVKQKGICFKCSNNGQDAHGIFGSLAAMIMFTQGIDYVNALETIKATSYDGSVDSAMIELDKAIATLKKGTVVESEDFINIPVVATIPFQQPADNKRIAKYLLSRKRPMNPGIINAFPVWESAVPFLVDRMIFEVVTNNSKAWLAYYIGDDKQTKKDRKTLNPSGGVLSCMLFEYNRAIKRKEPLLICEGVFDTIRMLLRGYNAVACFGKNLSPRQIMLINETAATEVVLCFDGDSAGLKGAWKIVKKWFKEIEKPLSIMKIPYGQDPDDASAKQCKEAFKDRRRL